MGKKNQSFLVFTNKRVFAVRLDLRYINKNLNLSDQFKFGNFNELQIIVDYEFLLIFNYDKSEEKWIGKVFSLELDDENSLFNLLASIPIEKISKEAKLSFYSFSGFSEKKDYLFSINIKDNFPIITYWEVDSQLSDISIKSKTLRKNKENKKFSLGNCIVNYFYHCFIKYPLQYDW